MTLMAASWPVLTWRPWRTQVERRSKTWVTDLHLGHIYSTFPSLNLLRTEQTQFASSNSLFWSDFWWESRWAGLSPLQSRFLGTYLCFALSICPEFVDKQKCTIYSQRLFCKYGLSKGWHIMDPSSKYCSKIQQQPLFSLYSAGKKHLYHETSKKEWWWWWYRIHLTQCQLLQ